MRLSLCPSATRYQYIAILKPTSRHLRDCSMLMRMLTLWSCFLPHLAGWLLVWLRFGCFHDLLIIIEESACGWFASTMSICSSSISVCRKEKKTVVDLYLPKNQPTFCISPRNMMSVSERTLRFYQNERSFATFLKGLIYVVKHWQRLLLFLYCISLLCYKFTSFVNVFPDK